MEDNKYCVYVHTNTFNQKKYVGITKQKPINRWNNGKGYKDNLYFYRSINKYGWENFTHDIIHDSAVELEKYYIQTFNLNNSKYGYNMTLGGDGTLGCEWSDESRKRASESAKRRYEKPEERKKTKDALNKPETKKRIKEERISRYKNESAEVKQKRSDNMKNYYKNSLNRIQRGKESREKWNNPEIRAKMSGVNNHRSKLVEVYKDGVYLSTYANTLELERKSLNDFGVRFMSQHISNVATGKRKQHKVFQFKYTLKEEAG